MNQEFYQEGTESGAENQTSPIFRPSGFRYHGSVSGVPDLFRDSGRQLNRQSQPRLSTNF